MSKEREFIKDLGKSWRDILDEGGITYEYLRRKLKKELNAKEVKTFKDGKDILYSDPMISWDIRQRARQDAHKLRGDYPAEEHKISGDLIEPRSPEERKILQDIARTVAQSLRKQGKK
ncbi:MAG: hypothetical protein EHM49_08830 [Deltaproteobacteria bacterium]|nr:MAG: hypothetical protein EHM49_08830 [Deltaproteobacteria bacterium]